MPVPYQSEHRALHDRFDTRRLADRVNERLTNDEIDARDRAFIESVDMFFIATVDRRGVPTCSHKGGDPGFVRVLNPHELGFPLYDGNGMFLTAGNVAAHPSVGLLFIDFERGRRLRIHGEAELDEGLAQLFPGRCSRCACASARFSRTAGATFTAGCGSSDRAPSQRPMGPRRPPTGSATRSRSRCFRRATPPIASSIALARGSSRSRRRSSASGPATTRAEGHRPRLTAR